MSVCLRLGDISNAEKSKIAKDLMIVEHVQDRSGTGIARSAPPFPFLKMDGENIFVPASYYNRVLRGKYGCKAEPLKRYQRWEELRPDFPKSSIALFDKQKKFYEGSIESLEKTGGAILGIPPGEGKTILGTHMAMEAGFKWAVIVPFSTGVTQWVATYANCFTGGDVKKAMERIYIPPIHRKCEKWQENERQRANSDHYDCIIAMEGRVKNIPEEARSKIGFLILDEGHVLSTRSKVEPLLAFTPQYVLVETATLERDDKKDIMMKLLAGNRVVCPDYYVKGVKMSVVKNSEDAAKISRPYTVVLYKTGVVFPEKISDVTGKLDFTDLVTKISEDEATNEKIVQILEMGVSEFNKKFIVITRAVEQARLLSNKVSVSSDAFVSNMKTYSEGDVLFGTPQKIGIGFDESTFCKEFSGRKSNAMILTHTVKKWQNFEQFKGRVMRAPMNMHPIIIIMLPENGVFARHCTGLKGWIKQTGGSVVVANSPECMRKIFLERNTFEKK